jgi:hypothetical protein
MNVGSHRVHQGLPGTGEIDKTPGGVGVNELDTEPVAHVQPLESPHHPPLGEGVGNAYPCSLIRRTGDNRIEALSDPRREQ